MATSDGPEIANMGVIVAFVMLAAASVSAWFQPVYHALMVKAIPVAAVMIAIPFVLFLIGAFRLNKDKDSEIKTDQVSPD